MQVCRGWPIRSASFIAILLVVLGLLNVQLVTATTADALDHRAPATTSSATKTARTTITCSTSFGTKSRRTIPTSTRTTVVTSQGRDVTRTSTPSITHTPAPLTQTMTIVRTALRTTEAPTPTTTSTTTRTAFVTIRSIDAIPVEIVVTSTRTVTDYPVTYLPTPPAFTPITGTRWRTRDGLLAEEEEEQSADQEDAEGRDDEATVKRTHPDDHHHHHHHRQVEARAPRQYPREVSCVKELVYFSHHTVRVTARTTSTIVVPPRTVYSSATVTSTRTVTTTPPAVTSTTLEWTTLYTTVSERRTDYRTMTYVTNSIVRLPGGPTKHLACRGNSLDFINLGPDNPPLIQIYNRGWNTPALSTRVNVSSADDCCEYCHSNPWCMATAWQLDGSAPTSEGRCIVLSDPAGRQCTADQTTPYEAGFYSSGDPALTGLKLLLANGPCAYLRYGGKETDKPKSQSTGSF